ncbi:MAG: hypothetical protein PHN88_13440 [Ignavibacteria bacterium]|nr:hypothetical protein [Ignavibacteria bacterium]
MKKLIIVSLLVLYSTGYAQFKDTSDYFTVGIYGGSYIGEKPLYEPNHYLNSLGLELEYVKSDNLSFFARGLYQFTGNDIKYMFDRYNSDYITDVKNPATYRLSISLGARYYLRKQNVNPYFQFSLNHETSFIDNYSYKIGNLLFTNNGWYSYHYSAALGAGLNIKLSKRLLFDFQYDLYRDLEGNKFIAFSAIGGFKIIL